MGTLLFFFTLFAYALVCKHCAHIVIDFVVYKVENLVEVIVVQTSFCKVLLYLRLINIMVVHEFLFGGGNASF